VRAPTLPWKWDCAMRCGPPFPSPWAGKGSRRTPTVIAGTPLLGLSVPLYRSPLELTALF